MMRFVFKFCLLLGFLVCLRVQAQVNREVLTLPMERQVPDQFWRFQSGHNPAWANPAYPDQRWTKAAPSDPLPQNQALWRATQGWFRLPFRVAKKDVGQPLQLVVSQLGTTTWYLDGRLLAVLEPPASDGVVHPRNTQFIALRLLDTNRHLLAVHYRFRPQPIYYAATNQEAFQVRTDRANQMGEDLSDRYRWGTGLGFGLASLFLLLGIVHLMVYRANLAQSINQWLAATQLALGLFFLLDALSEFSTSLTAYSLLNLGSVLSGHLGYGLLLTVVYRYVRRPFGWFYWLLVSLLTASFSYRLAVGVIPDSWNALLLGLVLLDYCRVSWLGKRLDDTDARLPWQSLRVAFFALSGVFLMGILVGILAALDRHSVDASLLFVPTFFLLAVAILSVPVGLSLSLVRDYTRTHQALRVHVQQVEQLSARTLAQEQEKQALLAQQNQLLEQQVQHRTAELHLSLEELRTTQDQLIQREKLASLGELTAGIAHEIQNPLNFVNNFSEVSSELVEELKEGPFKQLPESEQEYAAEILGDLTQNLQKINHHGKRADGIVKGMLEHSRASTGAKGPTDLNALVDEYLKLAYYGLRAKDKEFTAELITNFDPDLGLVEVIPQDLGRVLLNLFNNAFYAVQEKQKTIPADYQPVVTVSTHRKNEQSDRPAVDIRIKDNGTGMPDSVKQKIFQPFFTTKPTGEGTGLGLSLSYDIVTKGHGGQLSVETQAGEGTQMVITLRG